MAGAVGREDIGFLLEAVPVDRRVLRAAVATGWHRKHLQFGHRRRQAPIPHRGGDSREVQNFRSIISGISGEIGFEDTLTLSANGTYRIVVDNFYAFAGTTTLQLFTVPAQTTVGTLTFNGPPVNFTTTVPGQDVGGQPRHQRVGREAVAELRVGVQLPGDL